MSVLFPLLSRDDVLIASDAFIIHFFFYFVFFLFVLLFVLFWFLAVLLYVSIYGFPCTYSALYSQNILYLWLDIFHQF